MRPHASLLVTSGMTALVLIVATACVVIYVRTADTGVDHAGGRLRRAGLPTAVVLAWMSLWAILAGTGVLARFDARPPPVMFLMLGTLVAGLVVGLSRVGRRVAEKTPLGILVALQIFRLPLELVMHQAAREGVMPVQLSFAGFNFDIVTGTTALLLALGLWRGIVPRALVTAWNVIGIAMLANITWIALATSPLVHAFGADPQDVNTWVAYLPFVWLPSVLVVAALAGHIVIARQLWKHAPRDIDPVGRGGSGG